MVVICVWCALFVTSQFDVIFMFPNQRFGEVDIICIFFHTHSRNLCVIELNIIIISAPAEDIGGKYTQRYITAVRKISGCAL